MNPYLGCGGGRSRLVQLDGYLGRATRRLPSGNASDGIANSPIVTM